jgi:hypothetical protein
MMKNYMTMGTFARSKKLDDDSPGKAATPFPQDKAVMSIYGGPAPTSHVASSSLPADQSMLRARWSQNTCVGLNHRSL